MSDMDRTVAGVKDDPRSMYGVAMHRRPLWARLCVDFVNFQNFEIRSAATIPHYIITKISKIAKKQTPNFS